MFATELLENFVEFINSNNKNNIYRLFMEFFLFYGIKGNTSFLLEFQYFHIRSLGLYMAIMA